MIIFFKKNHFKDLNELELGILDQLTREADKYMV